MLCLNKLPRLMIYFLPVLFAVPFLCSSGSASATSYSFSPEPDTTYSLSDLNLDFTPLYFTYDVSSSNFSFNRFYIEVSDNQTPSNPFSTNFDNSILSFAVSPFQSGVSNYSGVLTIPYYKNLIPVFRFRRSSTSTSYNITFTFYDSLPGDCDPCPECPECPEVPEYPYSDILNKIYIAILTVSATALCIYFFYAFYNMFFGGIKR